MVRKLRRLSKLSPVELLVFSQLFFFAIAARVMLRCISLSRFISFLSVSSQNPFLRHFPIGHRWQDYSQLSVVTNLAARAIRAEGPCLLRSLLLFWLLNARGEHAELFIGVSKAGSALNSHAWVTSHGNVLGNSEEDTLHFSTLLRF
jgi:hypothetical protein